VVPLSLVVLVAVPDPEARHRPIGKLFGPIMVLWFLVLAGLGVHGIASTRKCSMR
jgi:KUP system potassium uptake protein